MKYKKIIFSLLQSPFLVVLVSLFIATIPFFWFKVGYLDIGGDSSRLYFYDPTNFLIHFVLNIFLPDSLGIKSGGIYMIPYVSILIFLQVIFRSAWFVNNLVNSISLVVPFLVVYILSSDSIRKFFKINQKKLNENNIRYASIIAGLFYILIPISSMAGWDLPLIIQTKRFVYPLLFLLLFKFVDSNKSIYLAFAVLLSFLFAQNFSWVSLPDMVGFFLVTGAFLFTYWFSFSRKKLSISSIIFSLILFVIVHSFHLLPLLSNVFEKNSDVSNQLLQGNNYSDIIHYIESVASYTRKGYQFIGLTPFSQIEPINLLLIIFPLLTIFLVIKNKVKRLYIPISFFLLLYFIITAHITNAGFSIFKILFTLPGFVMFRNFYGRWLEMFLLLYALLISYAVYLLFISFKEYQKIIFSLVIISILIINAIPFLKGDMSNRVLTNDTGVVVKSRSEVDSNVETLLQYFRQDKTSERNIYFPIADFDYQILAGKNSDGAYFGPSMFAYLSGKNDLASSFTLRPFTNALFQSVKDKNYEIFANIFPILGINTLIYNEDPYTYEVFETFPYNDAKSFMPKTQAGYKELTNKLPLTNEKDFGNKYHLYSVLPAYTLPKIYIPQKITHFNQTITSNYDEENFNSAEYVLSHFKDESNGAIRNVFLDNKIDIQATTLPAISFSEINPSKYMVSVKNVQGPYLVVFSQSFSSNWKIFEASEKSAQQELSKPGVASYFDNTIIEKARQNNFIDTQTFETLGKKPKAESKHFIANSYANSWYITPSDFEGKKDYTFIIEMTDQRLLYIGVTISSVGVVICLLWIIKEIVNKKQNEK